jgi:hypothetical protein
MLGVVSSYALAELSASVATLESAPPDRRSASRNRRGIGAGRARNAWRTAVSTRVCLIGRPGCAVIALSDVVSLYVVVLLLLIVVSNR